MPVSLGYEPSPVETVAVTAVIRTVDRNLTEGFMRELTWNFSLSAGSSIITVTIEYKSGTTVATYVQQTQTVTFAEGLRDRFNLTWIPTKATLIIFNVTSDELLVQCFLWMEVVPQCGKGKFKLLPLVGLEIITDPFM